MKTGALVLGWIPRIVTTIARSLHRHGVPVDVADCVLAAQIRSSAIREFVRLPYPNTAPDDFLNQLCDFIRRQRHDTLIPADDLAIAAVMEHYDTLQDLVRIACPPPDTMHLVLNKSCTLKIAGECGIRVPKTLTVSDTEQLPDIAQQVSFPWILKPAEKEKRFEEFTSCKLESVDDIQRVFPQRRTFNPPLLLQEFCPGVGVGVEMLIGSGECLATFQHRRLKELPYTGGVAVTAISESPNSALAESSLALLRALGWEGIAMVEYRLNPANGEAVLMEVNGRYWGTVSLPVAAGLDFPWYHWQLMHGATPQIPPSYTVGMKWRWTIGYLDRLYRLLVAARHSREARAVLTHDLLHAPADVGPSVQDSVFRFSDPLQACLEFARAMKYFVSHSFGAVLSRKTRGEGFVGSLSKPPGRL